MELVRSVVGAEGFYRIGSKGSVWSCKCIGRGNKNRKGSWRKRKVYKHIYSGHWVVGMSIGGKQVTKYIHRLILEAFVGPCPSGMECRHLDGNVDNNNLSNLEWATFKINQQDRTRHGTSNRGERCATAKLTAEYVVEARIKYKTGRHTYQKLADEYSVTYATMYQAVNGITWRHILDG